MKANINTSTAQQESDELCTCKDSNMLWKLLCFLFFLSIANVGCNTIQLKKISSLYIPSSYSDTGTPRFSLTAKSAEQLAYDTGSKLVYVVGKCSHHFAFFFYQPGVKSLNNVKFLGKNYDYSIIAIFSK